MSDDYVYVLRAARPEMLTEGPTPREAAVVSAHVAYLRDLAARDVAVLFGRTRTSDERTFGLVIFRAETETAARAIMDADPAVTESVMRAELFPYRILHPARP